MKAEKKHFNLDYWRSLDYKDFKAQFEKQFEDNPDDWYLKIQGKEAPKEARKKKEGGSNPPPKTEPE